PRHRRRRAGVPHRRAVLGAGVRPGRLVAAGKKGHEKTMSTFRYHWEDFPVGKVVDYDRRVRLTQEQIVDFARQWDPQRFHTDPQAASETPFGGLVASGWHTGCVMMRMMCDAYLHE